MWQPSIVKNNIEMEIINQSQSHYQRKQDQTNDRRDLMDLLSFHPHLLSHALQVNHLD
jgi:hypothetical protein